jgi:hypothetical protein
MDALAELAGSFADGTELAWRLASFWPSPLQLQAGAGALAALADEAVRRDAAREAARATGLPIPIPGEPMRDLSVGHDEAALMLGVLRHSLPGPDDLAAGLARTAIALVDPGLVIALCTDPQRIPRRLAACALRGDGAVRIAERLIAALERGKTPLDLLAIVEETAGLSPAQ